ncbi:autotransporter domain-containing protein [Bradyrhizobium lablabi]|uniref:autotransporter outer membrane beta-barrel domain-containing protein n=1 Tax=Bradyrhizobium lablabi TaxID=722472 RepID=UPI001BA8B08F|nr:autotransporter outer membrane beta-barrel domain-containing protein [Bradyrhizobium lablabi]MBR1124239.1 autotransporter domain-containing protein [Bradyrhizobium lablabi]
MKFGPIGGKGRILAGIAFAMAVSTSSGAFAQCVGAVTGPGAGPPANFGPQFAAIAAAGGAASGSFAAALGNMSTAFLSQQGSAFVSAPGDPKPNQPGGGVWTRSVGGEVTNKFNSAATGNVNAGVFNPVLGTDANFNCAGSVKSTFVGTQVGQDISRLNVGGWNLHVGTTAGYLSSRATSSTGSTDFEIPFFGAYGVATYGRFFADIMVREEFYNSNLTNTAVGLFGQQVGARGVSVSTSAGYNFALANNWFIEPSAGFIWSRTKVDDFSVSGGVIGNGIVSTYRTAPIESQIGRLSLRGGTTIVSSNMVWQPFASVSVFHEFAGNVESSAVSLNALALAFVPPIPLTLTGTNSTTRVGTYGQYSLGVAAQLQNTGWLGFARVDYRNGNNIDGWTGNAGLRYQFTPEQIAAAVMPRKAPVKALGTVIPVTNWTGFYVGGFLGVEYGNTDIRLLNTGGIGNNPRVMGGMGGFQAGYNYQFANNIVLGVEGDIGAVNLQGSRTCTTGIDFAVNLNCQNSSNWMATVAGRAGYSWDRMLFYVKAGGAWADDSVNVSCIFGPLNGPAGPCVNQFGVATNGFSTSGHRSGWLVGYGTEFDLGKNWSAKAEYDYIDLGSRTALATDGVTTLRSSGAINQVKVGVNYRFSGPTAVVAKY